MTPLAQLIQGLALGGAAIALHMFLLHQAIRRACGGPEHRTIRLAGSAPLRIILWTPVLYAVAQMGLAACVGALSSLLIGRALIISRARPDVR